MKTIELYNNWIKREKGIGIESFLQKFIRKEITKDEFDNSVQTLLEDEFDKFIDINKLNDVKEFVKDSFDFYSQFDTLVEYDSFIMSKFLYGRDREILNNFMWLKLCFLTQSDYSYFNCPISNEFREITGFLNREKLLTKFPDHPLLDDELQIKRKDLLSDIKYYLVEMEVEKYLPSIGYMFKLKENAKNFLEIRPLEIINKLHKILFDCNATIRDNVLDILLAIKDERSIVVLEKFIRYEPESETLKNKALGIIEQIKNQA